MMICNIVHKFTVMESFLLRGCLIEAGVVRVPLALHAPAALGVQVGDDPVLVEGVRVGLGQDGPRAQAGGGGARLDGLGVPGPPVHCELEILPHLVQEGFLR